MSALTKPRDGKAKRGDSETYPMAAGVKIFAGSIVVLDAGYAKPGVEDTGLLCVGRAGFTVDNTDGLDGYASICVEESVGERDFAWSNDVTNPVTQIDVGTDCFIVDDQTVGSDNTGRSVAGKAMGIFTDPVRGDQVWVRCPV